MFDGYMSFGGTEIVNVSRTWSYVQQAMPMFGLEDCYSCRDDLRDALGDTEYESVLVDQPDWFDSRNPDSWRFYGLWPLAVDGFEDAVRESTVTQLMTDGAAITAPRQQGREMTVSALLIGADDAAISYGLSWLRFALFGAVCRDSLACTGDHLCWFSACPPMCEDSPAWPGDDAPQIMLCEEGIITSPSRSCSLPYERTFYDVTVTEGPKIADRYDTACGAMVRVEWTMVAAVPWAYAPSVVTATTEDSPVHVIPNIDCTPGVKTVRRTNRFVNPVPRNTGGWVSHDAVSYPANRDTTVSRLEGRPSVKTVVAAPIPATNLATNPVPSGSLAGWGFITPADASVRTNLATNPRPAALTADWSWTTSGGSVAQTYNTGPSAIGAGFVRFTQAAATTTPGVFRIANLGTVTGTFTASVYLRPNVDIRMRAQFGTGDLGAEVYLPANQWTRVSGTSPGGAGLTLTVTAIDLTATGFVLDASSLLLEQSGRVGDYFNGSFPSDAAHKFAWTGTVDASTSTLTLPAPSATTVLGSGTGPNATTSYQHSTVVVPAVRGGWGPTYTLVQAITPGQAYTAQMWVRASNPTRVQLLIQGLDSSGQVLQTVQGPTMEPTAGAWTLLGPLTATFTVAVAQIRVRIIQPGLTAPVVRTNAATDPAATNATAPAGLPGRWLAKWFGGSGATGTTTWVTGASDGPIAQLTTYVRKTWTAIPTPINPSDVGWGWSNTTARYPVVPGHTYTVSRWFRTSVTAGTGWRNQLNATFMNDAGTQVGASVFGTNQAWTPGVWQRQFITFTVPVGVTWVVLSESVQLSSDTVVGTTMDETGVLIEESPVMGAYFSGNTPGSFDWRYAWAGTANASASTATSLAVAALPVGATLDAGSVQIVSGQSFTMPLFSRLDHIGQTSSATTQLAVSAGVTYTASVFVRPSRIANARVGATWYTSAGVAIGSQILSGYQLAAANSWTRIWLTAAAPSTAAYVQIDAWALATGTGPTSAVQVGDAAWWTDALLEQAPSALSYFDGSLPDVGTTTVYDWTGTADASTSTLSTTLPVEAGAVLDPDCAVVPAPPRPDPVEVSCLETPTQWIRYDTLIPAEDIPVWRDAVPVVRISTAALAARQVRIRFYPNEFGAPVEGLDQCEFCGEFVVSYIPPNSTMTIDGIRRTSYLVANNSAARQPASHLLYASDGGPMSWPELTCGIPYTITLDVSPTSVVGLTSTACVAARE